MGAHFMGLSIGKERTSEGAAQSRGDEVDSIAMALVH